MTTITVRPARPVLRYHGGKFRLAPWLTSFFPPHRVYVEPFGGGASVLLHKNRAHSEIYNDISDEIVNVFRVLRDPVMAARLSRLVRLTPFSRVEFLESYQELFDTWQRYEFQTLADGARPRTEVVWLNPAASTARRAWPSGFVARK
jgi:DNA adenine methylase